eukprot:TRINITY_DN7893_c0_g1_i1.p1 TRINITY_DN7893_c0_g1~~TRINITY_DN7893_c0_g1_i1.p1  ORF type:complete len:374 (+),score=83.32 TRINITY_DN7893_c0_g1_i1:50-1171(+)
MSDQENCTAVNDFLSEEIVSWIGIFIAALFLGSNYVVTKNFPTGDGFMFTWVMSMGILVVGFFMTLFNEMVLESGGLLGGSLWALGNLMVPLVIRLLGLGPAMCLWSAGGLLSGYMSGRFGFFGVGKTAIRDDLDAINILGAIFGVVAIFFYSSVKKDSELESENLEKQPILENQGYDSSFSIATKPRSSINASPALAQSINIWSFVDDMPVKPRKIAGVILAVCIGLIYGLTGIPNQLWAEDNDDDGEFCKNKTRLDFAFSQYLGIFLFTNFAFICYILYTKNKPQIFPETILPAFISGVMWAIASSITFVTNSVLSYGASYPVVSIVPVLVTSMWSILYFHEVTHPKYLKLLLTAIGLNVVAIICLAVSVE